MASVLVVISLTLSPPSTSKVQKQPKASVSGQASLGLGKGESADAVTQNDINQIIKSQLNVLGEHLSKIVKNTNKLAKKTSDTSKIKSSTKTGKHDQEAITQQGFHGKVIQTSLCTTLFHKIGLGKKPEFYLKCKIDCSN